MSQIAPSYGTDPFPEPPSNLLYGTPQYQPTVPDNPTQGGTTGGNTGHRQQRRKHRWHRQQQQQQR